MQLITKCDIRFPNPAHPEIYVKHYDTSRKYCLTRVEESLKAIGTTYIDLLLLHRPDPMMDVDEVAIWMQELKESGKVRYFGVSNFTASQMELLQSRLPFPLMNNQIELHVLHLAPFMDGTLDHLQVSLNIVKIQHLKLTYEITKLKYQEFNNEDITLYVKNILPTMTLSSKKHVCNEN
jgi:predicted oxidoreductase